MSSFYGGLGHWVNPGNEEVTDESLIVPSTREVPFKRAGSRIRPTVRVIDLAMSLGGGEPQTDIYLFGLQWTAIPGWNPAISWG